MTVDPWEGRDPDRPLDPAEAESWIRHAMAQLRQAETQVRRTNDQAVSDALAYGSALRAARLSPEAPWRKEGLTGAELREWNVDDRKAWAEQRCEDQEMAKALSEAALSAAKTRLHILGKVLSSAQSLNKNLRADGGVQWNRS